MRFPITTTDGKEYLIAGSPLVSKEKLVELYPEMEAAFERYGDEKLTALERGEAMVLAASNIIPVVSWLIVPGVCTTWILTDFSSW